MYNYLTGAMHSFMIGLPRRCLVEERLEEQAQALCLEHRLGLEAGSWC